MKMQVQKWGNSLALRIPASFAEETNLVDGSMVNVYLEGMKIVVCPETAPRSDLHDLLERVTSENLHGEIDTGSSIGREVWGFE